MLFDFTMDQVGNGVFGSYTIWAFFNAAHFIFAIGKAIVIKLFLRR